MALISLNDVGLTFVGPPLPDHVSVQLEEGERVGSGEPHRLRRATRR